MLLWGLGVVTNRFIPSYRHSNYSKRMAVKE